MSKLEPNKTSSDVELFRYICTSNQTHSNVEFVGFFYNVYNRDIGSYLKLGGHVVMWGHDLPPLVEIELIDNCPPCPLIFYVPDLEVKT